MGIDLKNKEIFKKNQKITKLITIVLIGVLILIVVIPTKPEGKNAYIDGNTIEENVLANSIEEKYSNYYEERLKEMLEKTYGKGNVDVMVTLCRIDAYDNLYGKSSGDYRVNGALVVVKTLDEKALSDITFSVCALFDLPAHKVAVMIKK